MRSERDMSAVRWKEGSNCQLQLPPVGRLHVKDTWDDSLREVEVRCWGRVEIGVVLQSAGAELKRG